MSNHSEITKRIQASADQIDVSKLTKADAAEYALRALNKIEQYMTFYKKLDVGAELPTGSITKIQQLRRYMNHRFAQLAKEN